MPFGRPPHVDGENEVVFGVCLQKLVPHAEDVLFALAPEVGVDHDGHANARSTHLDDNRAVSLKEVVRVLFNIARLVTDVDNHVLLVVADDLERLVAEPKIESIGQAAPVACRIVDFGNRDHPVCNRKADDVVQVADATTSIPDNTDAVGSRLRNFGNRFAFPVRPNKHVVDTAQDNLLVVLAVQKAVLYKKARFGRSPIHL